MSAWSSRLRRRWAVLRRLRGPGALNLAARVLPLAAAAPLLVRLDLDLLERVLRPRRLSRHLRVVQSADLAARTDLLLQVARPLVRRTCLTRGLTLYRILRLGGTEVSLAFGAGQRGGRLVAHCWLVRDGQPYLEPLGTGPRFEVMYVLEPAAAHRADGTWTEVTRT